MLVQNKDIQLKESDLETISGGQTYSGGKGVQIMLIACCNCGERFYANVMMPKANCPYCKHPNEFKG
jgi:hypothetical protein